MPPIMQNNPAMASGYSSYSEYDGDALLVAVVRGDLLDAEQDVMAHQCNCQTLKVAGLAREVFKKYPEANTYIAARERCVGTTDLIELPDTGVGPRYVANMYAQNGVGARNNLLEAEDRLDWFKSCLEAIPDDLSVAMPWNIGCGLAGGDWDTYLYIIEVWASRRDGGVVLYRL